jgi:hypothetical protein
MFMNVYIKSESCMHQLYQEALQLIDEKVQSFTNLEGGGEGGLSIEIRHDVTLLYFNKLC